VEFPSQKSSSSSSEIPTPDGRLSEQMIARRSDSFLSAEAQGIEHEHDDEDEHDSESAARDGRNSFHPHDAYSYPLLTSCKTTSSRRTKINRASCGPDSSCHASDFVRGSLWSERIPNLVSALHCSRDWLVSPAGSRTNLDHRNLLSFL
jgi:hypothetical protein